jgi:hypothetical protein
MAGLTARAENRLLFFVSLAVPGVTAYFGVRQQGLLKQMAHAQITLSVFDGFLVSVPSYALWLLWLVSVAWGVFLWRTWLRTLTTTAPDVSSAAMKERDAALAELSGCRQQHDALRASFQAVTKDALILREIAPFIRSYRAIIDLSQRLASFAEKMEEIEPSDNIGADLDKINKAAKRNAHDFDSEFRPQLVSLTTDFKVMYGLIHPKLTDDAIARPVYGQLGVQPFVKGLDEMSEMLKSKFVERATKLNV